MAELLPCPFCGAGESRIDHQNMWTGMRSQLVCVHIRHWCEKPSRSHLCITANTEEEAVDEWNKRAAAPPPAGAQQAVVDIPSIVSDEQADQYVRTHAAKLAKHHPAALVRALARLAAPAAAQSEPIDMVLHCPKCHLQHIDAPDQRTPDWKNEPHRSHLCHGCGHIWRPADVPTNGVQAIKTTGKADSPIAVTTEGNALDRLDYELLSELASIDCYETSLRDQPAAYEALERYRTALSATPAPEAAPSAKEGEADMYLLQDSRSFSYVGNCPTWWKKGGGYTTRIDEAERFTHAKALAQHRSRDTDIPWALAEIEPLQRPTIDLQDLPRSNDAQLVALKGLTPAGGDR
ncbi:hypothetical protein [Variovorax sp. tm]|uniref:hypothetical protein n=1 Tax=Variovorax atrisoli TaxID=3394203 RepID=UPI003A80A7DB